MKTYYNKLPILLILITICTQSTTCYMSHYVIEIKNKTDKQISLDSIVSSDGSYKLEIDTLINNKESIYIGVIEKDSFYKTNITHFILYYKQTSNCNQCFFENKFEPELASDVTFIQKIKLKE